MPDYSQYVKSSYIFHEPRELLPMPISVLLGVSPEAEIILKSLKIVSVFDLATSRIFDNARKIVEVAHSANTTFGRYGGVPSDVVDSNGHNVDVTELQMKPVQLLEGIGPKNGPPLVQALQVETIRDLALWPPYVAASKIVTFILTPEKTPDYDPEAPSDLIPRSGDFPTEKVFYRTVVIDQIQGQNAIELDPSDEAGKALNIQIDVADISMGDTGFNKIATGAIISMEQAWYAQGVALGNLLHSVALAPGESTNIAMIDWTRKTSANTNSNVSQTEMLSANTFHERSIEEVTNSVATEAQNGFSETYSGAKSDSHGYSSGGFVPSPFPIPVMFGASGSGSINKARGQTVTASDGRRDLFAKMTQGVTDSTQQNANSARTRRASIIKEVSQEEKETLTTRTVTNYNHMHAMSIQYYEVVQIYRTTTRVNKVDKCLFIPMKPINFRNLNSIDRFRDILWLSALNENVRSALNAKMQLVEIKCLTTVRIDQGQRYQPYIEAARLVTGDYVAEDYVGKRDYQPWKIKKDVQLLKIVAGDDDPLFAKKVVITRRNQPDVEWESQDVNTKIDFTLGTPIPIEDIDFIYAEYDEKTNQSGQLFLIFSFEEQTFEHYHELYWASEDYVKKSGGYTLELFQFHYSGYSLSDWLIKHLEQNRLHYSQAVWMNMGSAALSMLLSRYSYGNQPLLQQIDPVPVASTGNYLGFRMNADPETDDDWKTWLKEHGYYKDDGVTLKNTAVHETVPLPSGGVFAEAVLGRFNSAEKLDMTRFWNWQDSPIPFAAPDIAALQAGGKAQNLDPKTDGLEPPVVQQMAPTNLPDPQGLSAIINALTSANMFRDMSGLAQTTALAQAALNAATAADTAAGAQAGTNLANAGKYQVEMTKALMPLLTQMAGAGLGNISNIGAAQNSEGIAFLDPKKYGGVLSPGELTPPNFDGFWDTPAPSNGKPTPKSPPKKVSNNINRLFIQFYDLDGSALDRNQTALNLAFYQGEAHQFQVNSQGGSDPSGEFSPPHELKLLNTDLKVGEAIRLICIGDIDGVSVNGNLAFTPESEEVIIRAEWVGIEDSIVSTSEEKAVTSATETQQFLKAWGAMMKATPGAKILDSIKKWISVEGDGEIKNEDSNTTTDTTSSTNTVTETQTYIVRSPTPEIRFRVVN